MRLGNFRYKAENAAELEFYLPERLFWQRICTTIIS